MRDNDFYLNSGFGYRLYHSLSKIICLVVLVFACSLMMTQRAKATEYYAQNDETGYYLAIEDEAELLEGDLEEVIGRMELITDYGNVAFITTDSNTGSETEYAKECYRDLFGKDSGVLFLIDMANRQLYIFADGKVYKTITKSIAYTITDNVYEEASNGDFQGVAAEVFAEIYTVLDGGRISSPMRFLCAIFFALGLSLIGTYIAARYMTVAEVAKSEELLKYGVHSQKLKVRSRHLVRRVITHHESDSSSGGGSGGGGSSGGGGGHGF